MKVDFDETVLLDEIVLDEIALEENVIGWNCFWLDETVFG